MGYSFKGRQWNNETEWRRNNICSDKVTDAGPRHGGSVENKLFRRGCWENQLVTVDVNSQHPIKKLGIVIHACRCWENQLVTRDADPTSHCMQNQPEMDHRPKW